MNSPSQEKEKSQAESEKLAQSPLEENSPFPRNFPLSPQTQFSSPSQFSPSPAGKFQRKSAIAGPQYNRSPNRPIAFSPLISQLRAVLDDSQPSPPPLPSVPASLVFSSPEPRRNPRKSRPSPASPAAPPASFSSSFSSQLLYDADSEEEKSPVKNKGKSEENKNQQNKENRQTSSVSTAPHLPPPPPPPISPDSPDPSSFSSVTVALVALGAVIGGVLLLNRWIEEKKRKIKKT